MKHLLKLSDLSKVEIIALLNLADQLKFERKNNISHCRLSGKKLGMIFQKSSTRTRVSFEAGMFELGGQALFLSGADIQLGRGESVADTARVLSRYLDAVMIRTFLQEDVEEFAKYSSIPVINGLTDYSHPCQVLADLMTIREYKGGLDGLKIAYIGDGNNMANSLIVGAIKTGMEIAIACPKLYEPDEKLIEWAKAKGKITITDDIKAAASGADVLYTDVWASMGQENESKEREKIFNGYQINEQLMQLAKKDAIVLHCLPAHRGQEITAETLEKHSGEIFEQAENRLHIQKAIMCKLIK